MSDLFYLSNARTRSISAENPTGERGGGARATLENGTAKYFARELGVGWKVNPFIFVKPTYEEPLADITGSGCIQHIWIALGGNFTYRNIILRFYWDDSEVPSVECPIGDFFLNGWNNVEPVQSLAICVNPREGFNCYFQMPFRKHARITIENRDEETIRVFYQITYAETDIPDNAAYFHAEFRRVNPVPYMESYTVLDGVRGKGHYVGTYLAWGVNSCNWWGEGEFKFYMDGDEEFPTICGTGTEDYFGGAYDFVKADENGTPQYQKYNTPYSGLCQVIKPDGTYSSQQRFGMYRFHVTDPIRFESELKVTVQALGWRSHGRYRPLRDDIASVAYWYQDHPAETRNPLPSKDEMEVI